MLGWYIVVCLRADPFYGLNEMKVQWGALESSIVDREYDLLIKSHQLFPSLARLQVTLSIIDTVPPPHSRLTKDNPPIQILHRIWKVCLAPSLHLGISSKLWA